jgi:hypothetical protein
LLLPTGFAIRLGEREIAEAEPDAGTRCATAGLGERCTSMDAADGAA